MDLIKNSIRLLIALLYSISAIMLVAWSAGVGYYATGYDPLGCGFSIPILLAFVFPIIPIGSILTTILLAILLANKDVGYDKSTKFFGAVSAIIFILLLIYGWIDGVTSCSIIM